MGWGDCVKVLVLPGTCEQSVNMLNTPVYKGFFDFLPLLSKMVRYYKLRVLLPYIANRLHPSRS